MLGIDYSSSDEENDGFKPSIELSDMDHKLVKIQTKTDSMVNPFDANNYELSSSEDELKDNEYTNDLNAHKIIETSVDNKDSNERPIDSDIQSLSGWTQSKVSIFSNPFKEEETKELSQLERHVKLSDNKTLVGESAEKKTRTICWSYHKHKKCRFGSRCRFRHEDNDFIDTKAIKRTNNTEKRRVGITDSLIPPKRAIKAYYSQQNI